MNIKCVIIMAAVIEQLSFELVKCVIILRCKLYLMLVLKNTYIVGCKKMCSSLVKITNNRHIVGLLYRHTYAMEARVCSPL